MWLFEKERKKEWALSSNEELSFNPTTTTYTSINWTLKPTKNRIKTPLNQAFPWKFMFALGKWKWTQREDEGEIISHRVSQQPLKEGENSSLFQEHQSSRFSNGGFLEKRELWREVCWERVSAQIRILRRYRAEKVFPSYT